MSAEAVAPGWQAFGASTQGASHKRQGRPNQDAFAIWTDALEGTAIAVVSDGHGATGHPRSAIGSRVAVDLAVSVLRESVKWKRPPTPRDCRAALRRLTDDWQRTVREHAAAHPLEPHELNAMSEEEREEIAVEPAIAYGATIVAVAATPRWVALLQIGDGDALTVDPRQATHRPLPNDPQLTDGRTISLCQDLAWTEGRAIVLEGSSLPALVLLSTDGYANSFESDRDFLAIGADYASLLADDPDGLRQRLPEILAETSSQGSGDDITLAVLHRPASATVAPIEPHVDDRRLLSHLRRLLRRR